MAWYRGTGKENHRSVFENVEYDRCIFCGTDRTEIARTDFTIQFSEFEYNTGSICKSCYHANAKQFKILCLELKQCQGMKYNNSKRDYY